MGEAFDSFNAPQFVDFSKKHECFDDSVDDFFDVDHENKSGRKSSIKRRISSDDAYFSPMTELGSNTTENTTGSDNEADHSEPHSESRSEQSYEEPQGSSNLRRKSMSVGNLIMFSEEEYREEYKPYLEEICESVKSIDVSDQDEKPVEKPVEKKKGDLKSSSCIGSTQSLCRKESQDHLNKLARPKRYGSVENLKQGRNVEKFVSMAEAINQFQNRTPVRFRSKPNLHQQPFQPLQRTVPESPALQTKSRSRPTLFLSHEQQEQVEFENQLKFKIKPNPVNKKMLHGPVKPLAPVDKKGPTKPAPFNLTTAPPKKVMPSPKKFEFHAKPVPISAEKCRPVQQIRQVTKPLTPTFMKGYKAPLHKAESMSQLRGPSSSQQQQDEKPRSLTKPKPFSFDQRDKMVERKREQLIQKIKEEERRAREFHAKPIPKSIYKRSDSTSSLCSSKKNKSLSSENLNNQFKARPPTVLYKEPFVPAKADRPPTQPEPFQLSGEQRYYEREEFERERRLKEEKLEYMRQLEEDERLRQEEEEILRIRKEAEYKAKPIRKYKELVPMPAGKITIPISPKFHSNMLRQIKNKENVPDNSL